MLVKFKWLGAAAVGTALSLATGWAAIPARPGVLNYVEGQASLDGRTLSANSAGNAAADPGQVVQTGQGRVEMLLTPGVFLRLGNNSSVRMISPGLTDTRVEVLRGQAMVEADNLYKQNDIKVLEDGMPTTLDKKGLYEFNADQNTVAVLDGKATLQDNDKSVDIKGGHEVNLNGPPKAHKFDKDQMKSEDPLYAWSSVRSQYLSDASAESARTYFVNGGGFYGPGWYWDPYWSMYSFIPGSGIFYNPFGFGFYSPWAAYYYPPVIVGGFYGGHGYYGGARGFRGYHGVPGRGQAGISPGHVVTPHFNSGIRGGIRGGGFSRMGGFAGGAHMGGIAGGGHMGGFGGGRMGGRR